MIDELAISVIGLASALVSLVTVVGTWARSARKRSSAVDRFNGRVNDLKEMSLEFSRDNHLSAEEIQKLEKAIGALASDLLRIRDAKGAGSPNDGS